MSGWKDSTAEPPPPEVTVDTLPLALELRYITELRPPPGHEYVGVYWRGRLISRFAPPEGTLKKLEEFGWFQQAIPLHLEARTSELEVEASLYAIVDATQQVERHRAEHEPWAGSLPSYESQGAQGEPLLFPLFIGKVFRYPSARKYPENLKEEVADLLHSLLQGQGKDAGAARLDEFLRTV